MKVLKFGGSSVGSMNSILSVKKIVEAVEDPVIVVVSALGGITDQLIKASEMAAKGDAAYRIVMSPIGIARWLLMDGQTVFNGGEIVIEGRGLGKLQLCLIDGRVGGLAVGTV